LNSPPCSSQKSKDVSYDKIIDNKEKTVYVVLDRTVDQVAEQANFSQRTKISFFKPKYEKGKMISGTSVQIEGPGRERIQDLFFKYKGLYTTDQVRTVVLNYIASVLEGIPIRDNGGVYFIPATKEAEFKALEGLFEKLTNCSLEIVPIIDTGKAKASMWKALIGDTEKELKNFEKDLEEVTDLGESSSRMIQSRQEKYQALRSKIENYEMVLSGTAENLKEKLQGIEQKLIATLVPGGKIKRKRGSKATHAGQPQA
jgi:hypothetical protein